MKLELVVELSTRRCWTCGRWWACESVSGGTCPMCARQLQVQTDCRIASLESKVSHMRGALTRAKRKK